MKVQCSKISAAYGDRDILNKVSILLSTGNENAVSGIKFPASKAALAGINGSGKTTLMQIIAGLKQPDTGEVSADTGCRISYLPQSGLVFEGRSLREEAETAWDSIVSMLDKMDKLGRMLEKSTEDDKNTRALVEEHHRLVQTVEESGYYRREETTEQVLCGLGFLRSDMDRECGTFSGGWQMRIALAKLLMENPDIMLLDEPTNYLDIEARTWLEDYLKRFSGGYLLVSHDRYFLDTTTNEVYEIFQGRLKRYAGNYSTYERTQEAELEGLIKRYEEQQEEIAKSQALIQRFRYKASKAAMVQERVKKLEKMEKIVIPESLKKIKINFPPPPHSGRMVLTLEQIEKSYVGRKVLSGLDLVVEKGERLVTVGKNGAGKTTLLRIIAGTDKSYGGKLNYGSGVAVGYFSQDSAEELNGSESILAFLENSAPTALVPKIRDMLGAFLFRGDDVYKTVSVLSGGEKSRLALLRLLLRPVNLLVLDEPTNHLDIHSKDVLLEALLAFQGTIIFVSHDRTFMEALSTKTLEIRVSQETTATEENGGPSTARLFYGNYGYYLERMEQEEAVSGEETPDLFRKSGSEENVLSVLPDSSVDIKQDLRQGMASVLDPVILIKAGGERPLGAAEMRELQKQRQTLLRRLEREEKEILAELEELEKGKAALEEQLARPENYSNGEKAKSIKTELDKVTKELEEKTIEWTDKAEEIINITHFP
ncbi:MAG: ABC-F family ATP-binding cassette domain-containing protein [Treponema sp.]|nr:ABC-F family ATP-binding cassette domain-containing protein [Treponema sp.]